MPAIPVNSEVSLRQAIKELEHRIGLGKTKVCESILADFPQIKERRDSVLELIYFEYVLSQDSEHPISGDELRSRFPEFDADLQKILNVDRAFRNPTDTDASSGSTSCSELDCISGGKIAHREELDGFGDYELLEIIGRGGMGVVYKARQRRLNRFVAVKTIDTLSSLNPAAVARFHSEAELVAKLQHPNIVQVHEVGAQLGVPFFSMELITGGTLAEATSERPLVPVTAAKIVVTLARAVHYAHGQSIVHRDLKPSNILLSPSQRGDAIEVPVELSRTKAENYAFPNRFEPKIADFGLAKYFEGALDRTATQAMIGTPSYMAPELIDSKLGEFGPCCDVYSLGAILYDALTGRPPFNAATVIETIQQVRNADVIPPSSLQSKIPRDLETICLKCLRKEPLQRYVSSNELAKDLQRFLDGQPILARPAGILEHGWKWTRRHPSLAGLVAAVLIASISITLLWLRSEQSRYAVRAALKHNDQLLYDRDIAIAQFEYQSNRVERSREILDKTRPEFRGWEWGYLYDQTNASIWESPKQTAPIVQVDISRDGKLVAAVCSKSNDSDSQAIHVWDFSKNELRWKLQGYEGCDLSDVRFSPNGAFLLAAAMGNAKGSPSGVRLWDLSNGDLRRMVSISSAKVSRFSRDGKSIFVGEAAGRVTEYSTETGERLRQYAAGKSLVMDLDFDPDGSRMVVATLKNGLSVWDIGSGKKIQSIMQGSTHTIAWSPDGKMLSASSSSGLRRIYSFDKGRFKLIDQEQKKDLTYGRYTPDARRFVSSEFGRSIEIHNSTTGETERSLPAHNGHTYCFSFDSSGRYMVTGGSDNRVRVWDLAITDRRLVLSRSPGSRVKALVISPTNVEMAVALSDHSTNKYQIDIRDVVSHKRIRELIGHTKLPTCFAFTPEGTKLLSGGLDNSVRVWNPKTGEHLAVLEGHESPLSGVSFLADSRFAVSMDDSGLVIVWNIENKSIERTWNLEATVTSVAFHPLRPLIAVACKDKGVSLLDAIQGRNLAELPRTTECIQVCFSPNGRRLATVGVESSTLIWQTDSLLSGRRVSPVCELRGQTDTINNVSFSPDGKRLVSSCRDESVRLFDVECGHELITLESGRGTDGLVHFSPDGRSIVRTTDGVFGTWTINDVRALKLQGSSQGSNIEWHQSEVAAATRSQNWFAAQFHQEHLNRLEPNTFAHFLDRTMGYYLGRKHRKEIDIAHESIRLSIGSPSPFDWIYFALSYAQLNQQRIGWLSNWIRSTIREWSDIANAN